MSPLNALCQRKKIFSKFPELWNGGRGRYRRTTHRRISKHRKLSICLQLLAVHFSLSEQRRRKRCRVFCCTMLYFVCVCVMLWGEYDSGARIFSIQKNVIFISYNFNCIFKLHAIGNIPSDNSKSNSASFSRTSSDRLAKSTSKSDIVYRSHKIHFTQTKIRQNHLEHCSYFHTQNVEVN